jgi:hypothetical protein
LAPPANLVSQMRRRSEAHALGQIRHKADKVER